MALRFPCERRQSITSPRDEEKLLSQNCDAETVLLGSILIDVGMLPVVAEIAQPVNCNREVYRAIYQAMGDLSAGGTPPDLLTVCDELALHGQRFQPVIG
jgi:replicative DNA helicase